ncbi:CARDB domain-containing protein [Natrinema hispanicum]|uniref:CARDB protein n=1 Tax=Natrinema hispanicum TaxID=392421 RepID=A0A1H9ZN67_9EURY|nr:CARDB domain-containing protein [Natrinema hispanicum]SDC08153.1 CARDB protein [Natrinema hispanicum]SES83124.1 CARDB protein [Natrinema hispanicum]
MRRIETNAAVVVLLSAALVGSAMALPLLGGTGGRVVSDEAATEAAAGAPATLEQAVVQNDSQPTAESELVTFDQEATADGGTEQVTGQETTAAVEAGVAEGVDLAQAQGIEVTQEQRTAALEAAQSAVQQYQTVEAEQVQAATAGAVHGSLIQSQSVNVTQIQSAVSGATDGALSQSQSANVTQLQSATWGAAHGALAQSQRVSAEQIQVASRGAAAGATREAGVNDIGKAPHVQEAAQGAAYGALTQYQSVTAEQRQRVTLEHVQHAAAGGAAGALAGSTRAVLTQEQRVDVEQRQRVTIKQVQKVAAGAAKGALVQEQSVSVEQTQAAARGAGRGALTRVQRISIEQRQRISITQVQEAAFGAAKGAISQSQEATVEQIQAAAAGSAGGVLVQRQSISVSQIQYAAVGAAEGAVTSAIQRQAVTIEQIQAAAFGAGEGAVTQTQLVEVTQVQRLAAGGASGSLVQAQSATVTQIQTAAQVATQETAQLVQSQRISITQLQTLTQEAAAEATAYAVDEDTNDVTQITQRVTVIIEQRIETIDRLEGTASIDFPDQESTGEQVTIANVSLSEGGFVAVYDSADTDPDGVVGVSDYLEPGDHQNVTIDLDEPLAASGTLVAVPHHDTNDDETFQYVDADGEVDVPYVTGAGAPVSDSAVVTLTDDTDADETDATLSVSDQEGSGETLTVDEANASVPYTVTASYDGETVTSDTFAAGEAMTDLSLELEPPIEENTSVNVSVVGEDGATLATETVGYTVVNDTTDDSPEVSLSVDNQTGDGETLTIDAASASVPYVLAAEYNGERVTSDTIEANATVAAEPLALEPPIEENTTVDVSVRAAADDAVLANDSIEYAVEEPEPGEPTANLTVADQVGDGETLTVTQANASVAYAITITDEDGTQLAASEVFTANETIGPEEFTLEPPLEANATLEVAVVTADDGTPIETASVEYTVDGPPPGFDVEFTSCQRAEVTASLAEGDSVAASTIFYAPGGVGNTIVEDIVTAGDEIPAPYNGTIVFEIGDERRVTTEGEQVLVEVPDYGSFGTYISGISSPEAAPIGSIDYPNLLEGCDEEIRPERPSIAVEETTPTEDGIDVTFSYENPNDAPLGSSSRFVEGTTTAEPPSEFEPGQHTFTVEWTPESDDERLVWEADFSTFGYEEPLTAATPPAGELEPSEPATFGVSITDSNSPVVQGEPLEVDAEIGNVGGENGTQTVSLAIDGTTVNETSVSLAPGDNQTVSFTAATDNLEPGEYPLSVSTANETAETVVTIEEPAEPAAFGVSITGTNSPVEQSEPLEVDTEIENVGGENGTQNVSLAIGETPVDEQSVTLAPGETQSVPFTVPTDALEPGEYPITVATENQTAEATITVTEPGEPATFGVSIDGTNSPVIPGEPLAVEATLENVGDRAGTQDVEIAVGGTAGETTAVTLGPGESRTITLNYETADLEPGEYPLTVSTENETAETTVTVEEPATFTIADVTAPETGQPGDEVTVSATIENTGDREGTQTVIYAIDEQVVDESSVTLAGGDTTTVSFTTQLPPGTSTHTIATDDDQASVTIEAVPADGGGADGNGETGPDGGPETPPEPPTEPVPPQQPEAPQPPEPEPPQPPEQPPEPPEPPQPPAEPQPETVPAGPGDGGTAEATDGGAGDTTAGQGTGAADGDTAGAAADGTTGSENETSGAG